MRLGEPYISRFRTLHSRFGSGRRDSLQHRSNQPGNEFLVTDAVMLAFADVQEDEDWGLV